MGNIPRGVPRPEARPRNCTPFFRNPPSSTRIPEPYSFDTLCRIMGTLQPDEAQALHWIAENGDVIIVAGETWLLTPAPKSLLDVLAAVGAADADLEPETVEEECEDEGAQCDDEGNLETDMGPGEDEPDFSGSPNPLRGVIFDRITEDVVRVPPDKTMYFSFDKPQEYDAVLNMGTLKLYRARAL